MLTACSSTQTIHKTIGIDTLHAQPVSHISASSFRRPHNADNMAALHPIVARHRIVELYSGQLRVPHLIPDEEGRNQASTCLTHS